MSTISLDIPGDVLQTDFQECVDKFLRISLREYHNTYPSISYKCRAHEFQPSILFWERKRVPCVQAEYASCQSEPSRAIQSLLNRAIGLGVAYLDLHQFGV